MTARPDAQVPGRRAIVRCRAYRRPAIGLLRLATAKATTVDESDLVVVSDRPLFGKRLSTTAEGAVDKDSRHPGTERLHMEVRHAQEPTDRPPFQHPALSRPGSRALRVFRPPSRDARARAPSRSAAQVTGLGPARPIKLVDRSQILVAKRSACGCEALEGRVQQRHREARVLLNLAYQL